MNLTIEKKIEILKKLGINTPSFYKLDKKNINNINNIIEGLYYLKIYLNNNLEDSVYIGLNEKFLKKFKGKEKLLYWKYYFKLLFFLLKINKVEIEKEENFFYLNYKKFSLIEYKNLSENYIEKFQEKTQMKFPYSFKEQLLYLREFYSKKFKMLLFENLNGFEEVKKSLINSRRLNIDTTNELSVVVKKIEFFFKEPVLIENILINKKNYILNVERNITSKSELINYYLEMVAEKIITFEEFLKKIEYSDLFFLEQEKIINEKELMFLEKGYPMIRGMVTGNLMIKSNNKNIKNGIFIKEDIYPQDIELISKCNGILTLGNNNSSHASIIARGLKKIWISNLKDKIKIYDDYIEINKIRICEGEEITLNSYDGSIYKGRGIIANLNLEYIDQISLEGINKKNPIKVYSNINLVDEIEFSKTKGSLGIGLLRTEHLMLGFSSRKYLLAYLLENSKEKKNRFLNKFFEIHSEKISEIFKGFNGKILNIRLFDFLINEILPTNEIEILELMEMLKKDRNEIIKIIDILKEENSILGIRGVRFNIFNNILKRQIYSIFNEVKFIKNKKISIGIIIPMISTSKEIKYIKNIFRELKIEKFKLGCMIETPRACLISRNIAKNVDFLSYGTNDLTQNTFSLSRDNTRKIIKKYYKNGIDFINPFKKFDIDGVGKLISYSIDETLNCDRYIKKGICGDQFFTERDLNFFIKNKIDYISCSNENILKMILSIYKYSLENELKGE